jgi:hypothetical protein
VLVLVLVLEKQSFATRLPNKTTEYENENDDEDDNRKYDDEDDNRKYDDEHELNDENNKYPIATSCLSSEKDYFSEKILKL